MKFATIPLYSVFFSHSKTFTPPVRVITVFFLLIFSSALLAQDTTWYDASWKKTTPSKAVYFRPPSIKTDSLYLVRDYYISGNIQMEGYSLYPNEEFFHGTVKWFDKEGHLTQKAGYSNGKLNGLTETYERDTLVSTAQYNYGKQHGAALEYARNGKISSKKEYRNGKVSGIAEEYYDNGKLKEKAHYENGDQQGDFEAYFPDGSLHYKGHIQNDLLYGSYEVHHPSQHLVVQANFAEGLLNGFFSLDKDGKTFSGFFDKGKANSWRITTKNSFVASMNFDSAGKTEEWNYTHDDIRIHAFYQQGRPVDKWTILQNGKLRSELEFYKARQIDDKEEKTEAEKKESGETSKSKNKIFTESFDLGDDKDWIELFPPQYFSTGNINDNPDDISRSPEFFAVTRFYADEKIKIRTRYNWERDTVQVAFSFPEIHSPDKSQLSFHKDADIINLILLKENYSPAAEECAVFYELPSETAKQVIVIVAIGKKLKKELVSDPSKTAWLTENIYSSLEKVHTKGEIAKAICKELYGQN
jgi:antitoxin component YwqK of YwqJK toxin-antitoxin module